MGCPHPIVYGVRSSLMSFCAVLILQLLALPVTTAQTLSTARTMTTTSSGSAVVSFRHAHRAYVVASPREKRVGFVTSAAYGHNCGRSLAMGYVASPAAKPGTPLEVTIVGDRRQCWVLGEPSIDPGGARMRA